MGAAALLVASGCPKGHSPSHRSLDPVWAKAQEAGIPVVFHVGGTDDLIDPSYFLNGLPIPPDFHGGEENFRSVDYMGIPGPPAQTLATMIFDGVLERFPDLRIGVIEQGAIWVPSWMRQMESAFEAFHRHEERLQALSLRPSRVRAPPGPLHAVPHRGRRLDHRAGRARGGAVLVRLPARRGRPEAVRALRGVARRRVRRGAPRVLLRQLPRPHGHRRRRASRHERAARASPRFDPRVPGAFLAPDYFAQLAELRRGGALHHLEDDVYLVPRYAEVRAISRDPAHVLLEPRRARERPAAVRAGRHVGLGAAHRSARRTPSGAGW